MRDRDLAKRLRELGCEESRSGRGSHRIWSNPAAGDVATIPDWGSKDMAPGTVRAVLRELGISREQFGPIR